MPDESPSRPSVSNDPNSLANLLPEYFDDFPSAPADAPAAQPALVPVILPTTPRVAPTQYSQIVPLAIAVPKRPPKPKKQRQSGGFNYLWLGIVALLGIVVLPILIFGAFVLIANSQPSQTTINVSFATTPLPTVFSITPGAVNPTAAPATAKGATTAAGSSTTAAALVSACPAQAAFGQVQYYTCARPVQTSSVFSNYFGLAEIQLAQNGQNGPANSRVYAVSTDSSAKVMAFYATSLQAQGYSISGTASNGTTPLGSYSAAFYTKGGQQVQIVALSVNKASPDGQVNAGQTLIRLSSS